MSDTLLEQFNLTTSLLGTYIWENWRNFPQRYLT